MSVWQTKVYHMQNSSPDGWKLRERLNQHIAILNTEKERDYAGLYSLLYEIRELAIVVCNTDKTQDGTQNEKNKLASIIQYLLKKEHGKDVRCFEGHDQFLRWCNEQIALMIQEIFTEYEKFNTEKPKKERVYVLKDFLIQIQDIVKVLQCVIHFSIKILLSDNSKKPRTENP